MTVQEMIDRLEALDRSREVWVRIPDHVEDNVDFEVLDVITDEDSEAVFVVG